MAFVLPSEAKSHEKPRRWHQKQAYRRQLEEQVEQQKLRLQPRQLPWAPLPEPEDEGRLSPRTQDAIAQTAAVLELDRDRAAERNVGQQSGVQLQRQSPALGRRSGAAGMEPEVEKLLAHMEQLQASAMVQEHSFHLTLDRLSKLREKVVEEQVQTRAALDALEAPVASASAQAASASAAEGSSIRGSARQNPLFQGAGSVAEPLAEAERALANLGGQLARDTPAQVEALLKEIDTTAAGVNIRLQQMLEALQQEATAAREHLHSLLQEQNAAEADGLDGGAAAAADVEARTQLLLQQASNLVGALDADSLASSLLDRALMQQALHVDLQQPASPGAAEAAAAAAEPPSFREEAVEWLLETVEAPLLHWRESGDVVKKGSFLAVVAREVQLRHWARHRQRIGAALWACAAAAMAAAGRGGSGSGDPQTDPGQCFAAGRALEAAAAGLPFAFTVVIYGSNGQPCLNPGANITATATPAHAAPTDPGIAAGRWRKDPALMDAAPAYQAASELPGSFRPLLRLQGGPAAAPPEAGAAAAALAQAPDLEESGAGGAAQAEEDGSATVWPLARPPLAAGEGPPTTLPLPQLQGTADIDDLDRLLRSEQELPPLSQPPSSKDGLDLLRKPGPGLGRQQQQRGGMREVWEDPAAEASHSSSSRGSSTPEPAGAEVTERQEWTTAQLLQVLEQLRDPLHQAPARLQGRAEGLSRRLQQAWWGRADGLPMVVKYVGEGRYHVTGYLEDPGIYHVSVRVGGMDILGSPFHMEVVPAEAIGSGVSSAGLIQQLVITDTPSPPDPDPGRSGSSFASSGAGSRSGAVGLDATLGGVFPLPYDFSLPPPPPPEVSAATASFPLASLPPWMTVDVPIHASRRLPVPAPQPPATTHGSASSSSMEMQPSSPPPADAGAAGGEPERSGSDVDSAALLAETTGELSLFGLAADAPDLALAPAPPDEPALASEHARFQPDAPAQPAPAPAPAPVTPDDDLLSIGRLSHAPELESAAAGWSRLVDRLALESQVDGQRMRYHRQHPGLGQLDLVFIIDATASMSQEIQGLAMVLDSMAQVLQRLPLCKQLRLAVVAYWDHYPHGSASELVSVLDFTHSIPEVSRWLAALEMRGGGDYPEAMEQAMMAAATQLTWTPGSGRLAMWIGDAPPHGYRGWPPHLTDMQQQRFQQLCASAVQRAYELEMSAKELAARHAVHVEDQQSVPGGAGSAGGRPEVEDLEERLVVLEDQLEAALDRCDMYARFHDEYPQGGPGGVLWPEAAEQLAAAGVRMLCLGLRDVIAHRPSQACMRVIAHITGGALVEVEALEHGAAATVPLLVVAACHSLLSRQLAREELVELVLALHHSGDLPRQGSLLQRLEYLAEAMVTAGNHVSTIVLRMHPAGSPPPAPAAPAPPAAARYRRRARSPPPAPPAHELGVQESPVSPALCAELAQDMSWKCDDVLRRFRRNPLCTPPTWLADAQTAFASAAAADRPLDPAALPAGILPHDLRVLLAYRLLHSTEASLPLPEGPGAEPPLPASPSQPQHLRPPPVDAQS